MRNARGKRRKRHTRSKAHAELVHFQNRCLQRVGVVISQRELKEKLFGKHRDGVFHAKQSLSRSKWLYKHTNGKEYIVVYDKSRKRFVTIMPVDWKKNEDVWIEG